MTRPVLAAIDLTHPEDQRRVLKRARQLAGLEGTPLSVITVLPDYKMSLVSTYFSADHTQEMAEDSLKALHQFTRESIGHDDDVKHVVRLGNVYEEVLTAAGELDAGLIVAGAHKPNFSDYLIGPNAARIARHAACSVYIVR